MFNSSGIFFSLNQNFRDDLLYDENVKHRMQALGKAGDEMNERRKYSIFGRTSVQS